MQPGSVRAVRRMVYPPGVTEEQPRIDSLGECSHCSGLVVWDEVYGWLHSNGWYAFRNPNGNPRPFMAGPAEGQP
jgi:hypothetical protein